MTATRAPHRIDPHTDRETRLCCDNNMISLAGNHKDFEETHLRRWIADRTRRSQAAASVARSCYATEIRAAGWKVTESVPSRLLEICPVVPPDRQSDLGWWTLSYAGQFRLR